MKGWKRVAAVGLSAGLVAALACGIAFGATKKKRITSVTLTIESDIKVGNEFNPDDIEVRSSSNKFSVDEVTIQNSGFEWTVDDVPQLEVVLQAADNYYFSLSASAIKLNGATYVTATKRDSSTKLAITMKLAPLNNQVAKLEAVNLDQTGTAYWEPVAGAGAYELKLYRDGKNIGGVKTTTNTYFQVYDIMTKPTTYYVKVRGVNTLDTSKTNKWVDSNTVYIDGTRAAMFAARRDAPANEWNQDDTGWWFKNEDGSFPRGGWLEIGGKWYIFDDDGYMRTGWIDWDGRQYFCGEDGAMWFDTTAPDGRQLGEDGSCIQ